MKNTLFTCLILSILLISGIYAQAPIENAPAYDPSGIIKGKIFDARTGNPLPYSSIAIYHLQDSSLITGAISGDEGSFEIRKVPFGRFYAEVKYIGYNRKFVSDILITPESSNINLGDIKLSEASEQLEEVTVTFCPVTCHHATERYNSFLPHLSILAKMPTLLG